MPRKKALSKKTIEDKVIPKKAVSKKTVPKKTVPKKTVPKKTVPKKTVPKKTVPKKTVPKKTVPKKSVLKNNKYGGNIITDGSKLLNAQLNLKNNASKIHTSITTKQIIYKQDIISILQNLQSLMKIGAKYGKGILNFEHNQELRNLGMNHFIKELHDINNIMMHDNPITINELNELNNIFASVMNKIKNTPDIPKNKDLEYIYSLWMKAMDEKPITYADGNRIITILTSYQHNPIVQQTLANDLGIIINPRVSNKNNSVPIETNSAHIQTNPISIPRNSTSIPKTQPFQYNTNINHMKTYKQQTFMQQPQMQPQTMSRMQPQTMSRMQPQTMSRMQPQTMSRMQTQLPQHVNRNNMNVSTVQIMTNQYEE